jgi:hypothetical protein
MEYDFVGLSKETMAPIVIFEHGGSLYLANLPRILFEDSKDEDGDLDEDIFINNILTKYNDNLKLLDINQAIKEYPNSSLVISHWRENQINNLL